MKSFTKLLLAMASLLRASTISGQLTVYDLPSEEYTWRVDCMVFPGDCILSSNSSIRSYSFSPTYNVQRDTTRFSPDVLFTFYGSGYVSGYGCNSTGQDGCQMTCDSEPKCQCQMWQTTDWTSVQPPATAVPCNMQTTLPNESITPFSEFVTYQSPMSLKQPDYLAVRCLESYATCETLSENSYWQYYRDVGGPWNFAWDYSDCSNGGICYVACDPRCTCTEYVEADNSSSPCVIGTPPSEMPSAAPSVDPATSSVI